MRPLVRSAAVVAWRCQFLLTDTARVRSELQDFPALSEDDKRQAIAQRLQRLLAHFEKIPDAPEGWTAAANTSTDEEFWRNWRNCPVITRTDLHTRFHPDLLRKLSGIGGSVSSTGGSTGEPTPFLHDREMRRIGRALSHGARIDMGWTPGMPIVAVWGSERDIGKSARWQHRILNALRRIQIIDGYRLSCRTTDAVVQAILKSPPVALYGFSSMLAHVAEDVLRRRVDIPRGAVAAAWCGGELLTDDHKELFEKAFHTPLLNFYGGRELGVMAYQTAPSRDLRIPLPFALCEILDERGQAVPPGVPGRLVWTSTVCRGTPFIRYDVGDLGSSTEPVHMPYGVTRLAIIHGRMAGTLRLSDGTLLSNLYWNHLFKDYAEVRQFQIVLKTNGSIEAQLVGKKFGSAREQALRKALDSIGLRSSFTIRWVAAIHRTRQGKLIQVRKETEPEPPIS